jgi:hypothetical protein
VELPTHKFSPIVILTTHKQRKRAIERADALREEQRLKYGRDYLNKSFTKGEGTAVGFICEEGGTDYYNENRAGIEIIDRVPYPESKDYDGKIRVIKKTLEFKGKSCDKNYAPQAHWNGSVACSNPDQHCDFYLHGRATKDLMTVWLTGFISKHDFFASQTIDTIGIKGQIDPSSDNGWRFAEDCFNVRYDKCWPPMLRDVLAAQLISLEKYGIENATERNCNAAQRRPEKRVEAHAVLPASC